MRELRDQRFGIFHTTEIEHQCVVLDAPDYRHRQRALERIAFDFRDQIGAAGDDAGLRAAEQFVAAEGHEVSTVGSHARATRFAPLPCA